MKKSNEILPTFMLFGDETPFEGIDATFCVRAERATHVRLVKGAGTEIRNFFEKGFTCKYNQSAKNQDTVSILCVLFWKGNTLCPKVLKSKIPYPARKGVRLVVKCSGDSVKIISPDRVQDFSSELSSASDTQSDTCALNRS